MLDAGVGHIPEDRQRRGLVLEFSIAENIALHDYNAPPDSRWGWLFPRRLVERARRLIEEFDVRGGGPHTRASASPAATSRRWWLHARWPGPEGARSPPSRLADWTSGRSNTSIAGSSQERDKGRAILLLSLELEEVLSLSDRILVIYEGRIVGEHTGAVTEEEIGLEMLGAGKKEAAA